MSRHYWLQLRLPRPYDAKGSLGRTVRETQASPVRLGTWVSFPLEVGQQARGPRCPTVPSSTRTLPSPTGTGVWPWSQCQGRGGRCFNVQQRPLCGFVRRLLNSIMQSACLYLARLLARAVVTLSTVIEPGVRATALRYTTNVVPAAALGASFTRSILATCIHVGREADTFVAVRRRHAVQFVRHESLRCSFFAATLSCRI